jgi:hypothetical protein
LLSLFAGSATCTCHIALAQTFAASQIHEAEFTDAYTSVLQLLLASQEEKNVRSGARLVQSNTSCSTHTLASPKDIEDVRVTVDRFLRESVNIDAAIRVFLDPEFDRMSLWAEQVSHLLAIHFHQRTPDDEVR